MKRWFAVLTVIGLASLFCAGCDDDLENPQDLEFIETSIMSSEYQLHRFFQLDLPGTSDTPVEIPGRDGENQIINLNSVRIYLLRGTEDGNGLGPDDIAYAAAYLDTTGVFWASPGLPDNDFQTPVVYGDIWTQLDFAWLLLSEDGNTWCIDLGAELDHTAVLAVEYEVVNNEGSLQYQVGGDRVSLPGEPEEYYRLKLIKPDLSQGPGEFAFNYEVRRFYSLGIMDIDVENFTLKIERLDGSDNPDTDENGVSYNQLFGLGDLSNPMVVDYESGLLKFTNNTPFNAGEEFHRAQAGAIPFQWEGTFLAENQAPELYDPLILPGTYPLYDYFRILVRHPDPASNEE